MPVRLSEGADAAPGDIRAFDVKTGALVWTFHTIPYPHEFGYQTFPKNAYQNKEIGGANNWAGMAVDKENGILFVPTGSAAYDFYGGNRKGKIFSPTVYWHWMLVQANVFGIFKQHTMIFGIETCQHLPIC
jgi:quinoprotein glucose dehydrogenase